MVKGMAMLGYCQSAALATVAKTVKFNTNGTLLLVCHSTYGSIINGRLLAGHADRTYYTPAGLEIASGKGRA